MATNTGRDELVGTDYREEYSRDWGIAFNWLRPYNDGMKRWLGDIIIPTPETTQPIPVIFATPERAFAQLVRPQVEGQVDIPVISFTMTGLSWEQSRFKPAFIQAQKVKVGNRWQLHQHAMPWEINYNVTVWAKFYNQLDYVSYALLSRFTPKSYVNVSGIASELAFVGHSDNSDLEPGADKDRTLRHDYQFKIDAWMQMPYLDVGSIQSVWALINNNLTDPTVQGALEDPNFVPKDVNVLTGPFELTDAEKAAKAKMVHKIPGAYTTPEIDASAVDRMHQVPKVNAKPEIDESISGHQVPKVDTFEENQ